MGQARKIVFFDGGCLLCSNVVRWTHRRDRRGEIWFAALDSDFAAEHRAELSLPEAGEGAETFAYWDREREQVNFKSSGALALLKDLGGLWAFFGTVGSIFPNKIRDWVYDLIARNRRQWFGTSEECLVPPESLQGKVLA